MTRRIENRTTKLSPGLAREMKRLERPGGGSFVFRPDNSLVLWRRDLSGERAVRNGQLRLFGSGRLFSSDRRIFSRGVMNARDLEIADRIFGDVSPGDAGLITSLAKGVRHRFFKTGRKNPIQGSTKQSLDQLAGGVAASADGQGINLFIRFSLSLFAPGYVGTPLAALLHERFHAVETLPEIRAHPFYGQIPLVQVQRDGRLDEIFRAVISNFWWSEVGAFMSEVRLADDIRNAFGFDLFSKGVNRATGEDIRMIRRIFPALGLKGVHEFVAKSNAYIAYKVSALYVALLLRSGATEFPDLQDVARFIGEGGERGKTVICADKVKELFAPLIERFVGARGLDGIFGVIGLTRGRHAESLKKLVKLVTGGLSEHEARFFLETEIDTAVAELGAAFFGEDVRLPEPLHKKVSRRNSVHSLGPRPLNRPSPAWSSDEIVAGKARIAGTFAEMLARLARISDEEIAGELEAFIAFAENADAKSSGHIYAKLLEIASGDQPVFDARWKIGMSMVRSGYLHKGEKLLHEAIDKAGRNALSGISGLVMKELIDLRLFDVIEMLVDGEMQKGLDELNSGRSGQLHFYANRRSTLSAMVDLIFKVEMKLSDGQLRALPKEIHEKIGSLADTLWVRFKKRLQRKINRYRRWFAGKLALDASIEEMTGPRVRKGRGGYRNLNSELVGSLGENTGLEMSPALIKAMLLSPALYSKGLAILREYPQSNVKVELYEMAAENMPKGASDDERLALADEYAGVVARQEKGIEAYLYREVEASRTGKGMKRYQPDGELPPFSSSHFYWRHMSAVAELLLNSKSSALKIKGTNIIAKGLEDRRSYANEYMEIDGITTRLERHSSFVPSMFWAGTLVANIDLIPKELQKGLLVKALNGTVGDEKDATSYTEMLDQDLKIARIAARLGHYDVLKLIVRLLEPHSNKERLMEKGEEGERRRSRSANRSLAGPTGLLDTLIPVFRSLLGEGSLTELSNAMLSDARDGRGYFELHGILEALKFLSDASVNLKMTFFHEGHAEALERMAESAVKMSLSSVGEGGGSYDVFSKKELSLSSVINELPLPQGTRDRLFTLLIEGTTPEAGLVAADGLDWTAVWEAYRGLDFIIGNDAYPVAEALLVKKLSQAAAKISMNPQDPRFSGALKALTKTFHRIAGTAPLGPENEGRLNELGAAGSLFAFRNGIPKAADGRVEAAAGDIALRYGEAVRSRNKDAVALLSERLKDAIAIDLIGTIRRAKNNGDREGPINVSRIPIESLLMRVYMDWNRCVREGERELAEVLFSIWSQTRDAEETAAKRIIFYRALLNKDGRIEDKRRIFDKLVLAGDILPHFERLRDTYLKEGDSMREEMLYEASVPFVRIGRLFRQDPALMQMLADMTIEEARLVMASHRKARDAAERDRDWRLDPMNRHDVTVLLTHPDPDNRGGAHDVAQAYIAMAHGYGPKILALHKKGIGFWSDRFRDRFREILKKELSESFPRSNETDVFVQDTGIGRLMERASVFPSKKDVAGMFGPVDDTLVRHKKAVSRIKIAHIDISSFFEGIDVGDKVKGVVRFLVGHLLAHYSIGEQQRILKATAEAVSSMRRLVFAEEAYVQKWFQMLGFWPGVPKALQAELRPLAENVRRGNRDEFIELIRRYLPDSADRRALIENLSEGPIGTGTIAETYRSRLANGTFVVVKGIPPTKEGAFNESRKAVMEVRDEVFLFLDELPGARQIARAIELFDRLFEREFDETLEVRNAERISSHLPEGFDIPGYLEGLITKKVVVQRYVEGERLDKMADRDLARKIAGDLRAWFYSEWIPLGSFHPDLHGGNVKRDKAAPVTWLLDFGQMGELKEAEIKNIGALYGAVISQDGEGTVRSLESMGEKSGGYDRTKLLARIESLLAKADETEDMSRLFDALFDACTESGLDLFDPYLVLMKGAATIEGMAGSL